MTTRLSVPETAYHTIRASSRSVQLCGSLVRFGIGSIDGHFRDGLHQRQARIFAGFEIAVEDPRTIRLVDGVANRQRLVRERDCRCDRQLFGAIRAPLEQNLRSSSSFLPSFVLFSLTVSCLPSVQTSVQTSGTFDCGPLRLNLPGAT
jgi:hypothetical protein